MVLWSCLTHDTRCRCNHVVGRISCHAPRIPHEPALLVVAHKAAHLLVHVRVCTRWDAKGTTWHINGRLFDGDARVRKKLVRVASLGLNCSHAFTTDNCAYLRLKRVVSRPQQRHLQLTLHPLKGSSRTTGNPTAPASHAPAWPRANTRPVVFRSLAAWLTEVTSTAAGTASAATRQRVTDVPQRRATLAWPFCRQDSTTCSKSISIRGYACMRVRLQQHQALYSCVQG